MKLCFEKKEVSIFLVTFQTYLPFSILRKTLIVADVIKILQTIMMISERALQIFQKSKFYVPEG